MRIGVPKEIKPQENRIGLTPESVKVLTSNGHQVLVEDNGGFEGDINGSATACTLTNCNTQAFVDQVNLQGLCGFYDWRLPTHRELMSLVHFGITDAAMIDPDFYPNTGDIAAQPLWYWTANPGADGVQDDSAQNAWAIDFASGVDNFLNKSEAARIRLVRAGREGL